MGVSREEQCVGCGKVPEPGQRRWCKRCSATIRCKANKPLRIRFCGDCKEPCEPRQVKYCRKCSKRRLDESRREHSDKIKRLTARCLHCGGPMPREAVRSGLCGEACRVGRRRQKQREWRKQRAVLGKLQARAPGDCRYCQALVDECKFSPGVKDLCAPCDRQRCRMMCETCRGPKGQYGCVKCEGHKPGFVRVLVLNDKDDRERTVYRPKRKASHGGWWQVVVARRAIRVSYSVTKEATIMLPLDEWQKLRY